SQLGNTIQYFTDTFPNLEAVDLAIVGIKDDRQALNNVGCAQAVDSIRLQLSRLFKGPYAVNIVDLGDIIAGHRIQDTYAAVRIVVSELIKQNIVPILIGGGQDI